MFLLYSYISAVLFFSSYSYGANILAALPTPSYSHQIAYTHIWRELSLRGHNVTLITTDPLKDPKLTNLTEIDMRWMYSLIADISTAAEDRLLSTWKIHNWIHDFLKNISEAHLSHSTISDLIRNRHNSFDVVLTEFLYAEFLAFAVIYECPKILFSSLDTFVSFHNAMGNNIHPALYPDMGLPFSVPRNFRERVESTLFALHSMLSHSRKIFPMKDQLIKNFFGLTVTTQSLIHEADMLFLNVNPVIQNIRAIGPTTINIGDLRRTLPIKPLPEDLKKFLDGAKDGFIYFSLGSNVKSKELRKESLNSIMQALGEMPYKVLWKFEDDYLPGKPQNVKLVKWAPQQAVLGTCLQKSS
ncbi:hypothetical protein NQ315_001978 [Exocentrus adspersus]|uniref:UDP-glucuronosyltransferase n=1 Tax=Exocentrus adspersus TaxID=1586481 RepID=A0AAV8WBN6_9CUCU|nr:hypothetical protein NQ315_001978 [Exocentrus adspersus]